MDESMHSESTRTVRLGFPLRCSQSSRRPHRATGSYPLRSSPLPGTEPLLMSSSSVVTYMSLRISSAKVRKRARFSFITSVQHLFCPYI